MSSEKRRGVLEGGSYGWEAEGSCHLDQIVLSPAVLDQPNPCSSLINFNVSSLAVLGKGKKVTWCDIYKCSEQDGS